MNGETLDAFVAFVAKGIHADSFSPKPMQNAQPRACAIVTRLPEVLGCIEQAAFRAPVDIRVAFHSLDEGRRGLSGVEASPKISQAKGL